MDQGTRPQSVTTGTTILYISLFLSSIGGIVNIFHIADGALPVPGNNAPPPFGIGTMITIVVVVLAIYWFLIHKISKGSNWARILYLVFVILGLLGWAINFQAAVSQGLFALIAGIINTLLGVIAMIYLFSPSARPWFKKK